MYCTKCGTKAGSQHPVFCASCGYEFPGGRAPRELAYASFWRRLGAFWVDIGVLTIVVLPLALWLFPPQPYERARILYGNPGEVDPIIMLNMLNRLAAMMVFVYILSFFYHTVLSSSKYRGSFGKYWLGMSVVDSGGNPLSLARAALREACRVASVIPFHLGMIWSLVDGQRRTFHDMLAGTLVVRRAGAKK